VIWFEDESRDKKVNDGGIGGNFSWLNTTYERGFYICG